MSNPTNAETLLSSLSDQLTEEKLAQVRGLCGIEYLEPGDLTNLIADQTFSVEDIVTLLMSGWILQSEEIQRLSERVAELEDLCDQQVRAIDEIANQSMRLRSLLSKIDPKQQNFSAFDVLKDTASRADTRKPTGH